MAVVANSTSGREGIQGKWEQKETYYDKNADGELQQVEEAVLFVRK